MELFPEYQYFTGVQILLKIDGQDPKSFYVSSIKDIPADITNVSNKGSASLFKSMDIREGTVGEQGQQFTSTPSGSNTATGQVTLYDKDLAVFRSLLESKTSKGDMLVNKMDITISTYSGKRSYNDCLIKSWAVNLQEGVPTITLKWQRVADSAAPISYEDSVQNINPVNLEKIKLLTNEGISNFLDFKQAVRQIFTTHYSFVYQVDPSSKSTMMCTEVGNDGSMGVQGKLYIPNDFLEQIAQDRRVARLKFQPDNDASVLLDIVMKRFCNVVRLGESGQRVWWKLLNDSSNRICLYAYTNDYDRMEPQDAEGDVLKDTVFVYNSGLTQPSLYRTPSGDKVAFLIDSFTTNFTNENVIFSNLEEQANSQNPNGNLILTSRGTVMLPSYLPQAISESIRNISSLNLDQTFSIDITVYNFIHFYVNGITPVNILVFDHRGEVLISRAMRVFGYRYDIGTGGVVQATVQLKADLNAESTDFVTGGNQRDSAVASNATITYQNDADIKVNIPLDMAIDYKEVR